MISDKFTDIVLDDKDMEKIEGDIGAYNKKIPLDPHSKSTLRQKLIREYKEGLWESRDYIYGVDEGLDYKGDFINEK